MEGVGNAFGRAQECLWAAKPTGDLDATASVPSREHIFWAGANPPPRVQMLVDCAQRKARGAVVKKRVGGEI